MRFMKRSGALVGALLMALALMITVAPQGASAHERRDLLNAKYQAVVGFLNEPAYESQLNAMSLAVTSKTDKNADGTAKPIEGLEKTVKAQVLADGKTLDLPLQAVFGKPGSYAAYFEPTKAGQYVFRFYGDINGEKIDERFESGPGRFNDVQSIAPLQFPIQVAAAAVDTQAQVDAAQSTAESARMIGIIGVVVGVIGLVVAGVALLRRPGAAAGAARLTTQASEGAD